MTRVHIQHWRMPLLIAALLACTTCGKGAEGSAQEAGTAVYGAPPNNPPGGAGNAKAAASLQPNTDPGSIGDAVLAYPDDMQVTMLAYRLTGRTPPLSDWAAEEYKVRRADEFSRAPLLQEETTRLAAIYEATENVGYLQYRLNSQLSQYDSAKGGYYLTAFTPGQQTTFSGREQVSLLIDNMKEAYFWPLEPDDARDILAQTSRNVSLDVKIRITGSERRSSGLLIKGQITDYGIYSQRYNDERVLAQFSLD